MQQGVTQGLEVATWYYVGSFGQLGPLTLEQMEELIDGGVIEGDTHVWNPQMPNWMPASVVPQFSGLLARRAPYASPPPVPVKPAVVRPGIHGASQFGLAPSGMNSLAALGRSDRSRILAGVLNLLVPGVGRMYLGYSAIGVLQLVTMCFFVGWLWAVVDGILILVGAVKLDGYGRQLDP